MNRLLTPTTTMVKINRICSLLLVFVLLTAMAPIAPTSDRAAAKAQPHLVGLGMAQPDQWVNVIVQKTSGDSSIEAVVERLGGVVTRDFHIINGFGARLRAGAALRLAQYPGIRWISLDGSVIGSSKPDDYKKMKKVKVKETAFENHFLDTLNVRALWERGITGQGITVAVIDSGIADGADFTVDPAAKGSARRSSRLLERVAINPDLKISDSSGHGTHVAAIIGGNGAYSDGTYAGIAPQVNLIGLNISNFRGMAYESDTVAALQWVLDHKDTYNIRVVNLSINSTVESSYHTSALNAAAEILWFNGIVVVTSAGNKAKSGGPDTIKAAPANDPFLITVGATNEKGDSKPNNDSVASFSPHGTTLDGHLKPEVVAPGTDIVSLLAPNSDWGRLYPARVDLGGYYFVASGTSMAAPMVAGAVALLLQDQPHLTPDQVKHRLMHAGRTVEETVLNPDGTVRSIIKYAYLDAQALVNSSSADSANTGLVASQLLWQDGKPVNWTSVNWNSVNWNSVNWNSVNWNSVNWNSVNWNSITFSSSNWGS